MAIAGVSLIAAAKPEATPRPFQLSGAATSIITSAIMAVLTWAKPTDWLNGSRHCSITMAAQGAIAKAEPQDQPRLRPIKATITAVCRAIAIIIRRAAVS